MSRSSSTGFTVGQVFKAWCWTYLLTSNVQYSLALVVNAKPPLLSLSLRSISLLPGLVLFLGCQNYEDCKNGVRRWEIKAFVDSLLLKLLSF